MGLRMLSFAVTLRGEHRMLPPGVTPSAQLPAGAINTAAGRSWLQFTPDDFFGALLLADGGDMSLAADMCTALWGYGIILAASRTRFQSVSGAPVYFEDPKTRGKSRDGRRSGRVEKALSDDYWLLLPETTRFWVLWWFKFLGVALVQNNWYEVDPSNPLGPPIARIRNGRNVPEVQVVHPRAMRFDTCARIWYVRDEFGQEWPVIEGDPRWSLWVADKERPWLLGMWRALAALWIKAAYGDDDWSAYLERYAASILAVYAPEGSEQPERDEMGRKLNEMARDPRIVFPFGYKAEPLDMRGNGAQSFSDRLDNADRRMTITILGGNLIADTTGGAATGAQLQGEVRQDIKEGDAEELSTWEQAQGPVNRWTVMNFGDANLAPFPVHNVSPPDDEAAKANARKTTAEALDILRSHGYTLEDDVLERHNIIKLPSGELPDPVPAPQPQPAPIQEAA